MWSDRSRLVVLTLLLLAAAGEMAAQNRNILPKRNSPYSRFGLGDPVQQVYAAQAGMAGLGATYFNHSRTNLTNPASLGWMQFTAFEVGLNARYSSQTDGDQTEGIWSGNLKNLTLAFPLKNSINQIVDRRRDRFNWGMAFALQPYTEVGYNLELATELRQGDSQEIQRYVNSLKGAGGTYKLMFANGFRYDDLAVGFELGYLFGTITNSRRVELDSFNTTLSYATEFLDETSVRGWTWSLGAQYRLPLERDQRTEEVTKSLTFGAYGNSATSFDTKTDQFYSRDNLGLTTISDTLLFSEDNPNTGQLPSRLGIGVMYQELNRLKLGVDASFTNWSSFEFGANPADFENAYRLAVGGEFIPEFSSYNNYLATVRYRLGVFYGTDPRTVNGQQLTEYGLTFGMGLPLIRPRQQTSYIDLAFEVGQFGLSEAIRETYLQMTVGFTLNDNTWFFKRKFN